MNPTDLPMLVVTGIGGALCLLGFVALLLQKFYLEPAVKKGKATRAQTEVRIPGFGEISTTYPALAFLIIGAALVPTGMAAPHAAEKDVWHITVHLATDLRPDELIETGFALSPSPTTTTIDRFARTVKIETSIDKGKQFEDVVEMIDLSLPRGSGYVMTRTALDAFNKTHAPVKRGASGLVDAAAHTRVYELALTQFPAPLGEAQP